MHLLPHSVRLKVKILGYFLRNNECIYKTTPAPKLSSETTVEQGAERPTESEDQGGFCGILSPRSIRS